MNSCPTDTTVATRPAPSRPGLRPRSKCWLGAWVLAAALVALPLPAQTVVRDRTIGNGETVIVVDPVSIRTEANVVVENGGTLILWTGGQVEIQPGLHAATGARFRVVSDQDLDGFSDDEESTDADGDGLFDALEISFGLNPYNAADANADADGDGMSNKDEILAGRNPHSSLDGLGLPPGFQLVLRLPDGTFHGVNTATWKISNLPSP